MGTPPGGSLRAQRGGGSKEGVDDDAGGVVVRDAGQAVAVTCQPSWPGPSAQWQVGLPHRVRVRANEPGMAFSGSLRALSSS